MTVKLYHLDPYLSEFKATVTAVEGRSVVLDQTAFYPESGGQAGDRGWIEGVPVVDTVLRGGEVVHICGFEPSFGVGEAVEARLDWGRRHRIMRLHSASHIVEHFLFQRFGRLSRLGSHVDDSKDRSTYVYEGRMDPEALAWVQEESNQFISRNLPIEVTEDREGVRTWRCGPIEVLCGGTHVARTGEIGRVRLRRKNPGRGKEQVETLLEE